MAKYRRAYVSGASWFFIVNLAERKESQLLITHLDELRKAFQYIKGRYPFRLDAVVILLDHLHCICTLLLGDSDYSTRWNLLKGRFSRAIETGERISKSRKKRKGRGLWQRRFWGT